MNNEMENGIKERARVEIARIAKRYLSLETLEARDSDHLDFSQHAVWTLERALEAAFNAGRQAQIDAAAAAAEIAPMSEADKAQVERDYFGGGRSLQIFSAGFAFMPKADTELCGGMLIMETAGRYEPIACCSSIDEGREIAFSAPRPVGCTFRVWARGLQGYYATAATFENLASRKVAS